ncbi:hypothetical protein P170DRAFT_439754 [Aspergillus steynii IBT 23096]|uniref:Uncharacterized protein n=1 Tax=Aspergillus steynii IBT 23096 TaxID=1392250 RepID=A0A2I2FZK9_9EURO|nr:uncharacterized protein P170DRAFT_439754 [Aspergillus steynii IBT 23096]PLB46061.1 hypothetical protein P170DRAFT_439754 [Aspergillus steynii IBT 23096]
MTDAKALRYSRIKRRSVMTYRSGSIAIHTRTPTIYQIIHHHVTFPQRLTIAPDFKSSSSHHESR